VQPAYSHWRVSTYIWPKSEAKAVIRWILKVSWYKRAGNHIMAPLLSLIEVLLTKPRLHLRLTEIPKSHSLQNTAPKSLTRRSLLSSLPSKIPSKRPGGLYKRPKKESPFTTLPRAFASQQTKTNNIIFRGAMVRKVACIESITFGCLVTSTSQAL
jgi:hypothetical protein